MDFSYSPLALTSISTPLKLNMGFPAFERQEIAIIKEVNNTSQALRNTPPNSLIRATDAATDGGLGRPIYRFNSAPSALELGRKDGNEEPCPLGINCNPERGEHEYRRGLSLSLLLPLNILVSETFVRLL